MKYVYIISILTISLLLLSCTNSDYLISDSVAEEAYWEQMQTVKVSLNESSITPSTLVFEKGKPYKLVISNDGKQEHRFAAVDFFKSISTLYVLTRDGRIKANLKEIQLPPGKSMEIHFVAVTKDTYEMHCSWSGHADKGETGTIVIE